MLQSLIKGLEVARHQPGRIVTCTSGCCRLSGTASVLNDLEVDKFGDDDLIEARRLLYKERDHMRKQVLRNGAETFTKYGPEFTHTYKVNIDKVEAEIKKRLPACAPKS